MDGREIKKAEVDKAYQRAKDSSQVLSPDEEMTAKLSLLNDLVNEYYSVEKLDPSKLPIVQQQIWELIQTLVSGRVPASRILELFYWSQEPGALEMLRRFWRDPQAQRLLAHAARSTSWSAVRGSLAALRSRLRRSVPLRLALPPAPFRRRPRIAFTGRESALRLCAGGLGIRFVAVTHTAFGRHG